MPYYPIFTGVTAGAYTNANITVNVDGRITAASSGAAAVDRVKAWVTYDQISNVINESYNVSSVADNGAGNSTVNFDVDFSLQNYASVGTAKGNGGSQFICVEDAVNPSRTVAWFRWQCQDDTFTDADADVSSWVFIGQQ